MAHRVLIGGTAYNVKGGRTVINGTAYGVKGGRTVINGTAYPIRFAKALHSLPIGSSVFLNVGGVRTEFLVIHRGNPDPSVYDASCDGVWLKFKYAIYSDRYGVRTKDSDGDWYYDRATYPNSPIGSGLNSYVLQNYGSNFYNAAKTVTIPCWDQDITVAHYQCKFFILSQSELYGLDYFKNGTEGKRVLYYREPKTVSNAALYYWLRNTNVNEGIAMIHSTTGSFIADHPDEPDIRGYETMVSQEQLRPVQTAFILPPTVTVDDGLDLIF